jgi:hypothetical protein
MEEFGLLVKRMLRIYHMRINSSSNNSAKSSQEDVREDKEEDQKSGDEAEAKE